MDDVLVITDAEFKRWDESYTQYFTCPACKITDLHFAYKYCPHCGKPLQWELDKRHPRNF